jgi:hypothetical protein
MKEVTMDRKQALGWTVVVGLALMVILAQVLPQQPVQAGPLALPTAIAAPAGGGDWIMATIMSADTVSGTETSGAIHVAAYTAADVQYNLGFTDSETVTCKLQFSNDNSTWNDGPNLVAAAVADATGLDQFHVYGRYMRAVCTPTTENTFTATITAKIFN